MSRTLAQLEEGPKLLALSLKRCNECRKIKHVSDYYSANLGFGGLRAKCKHCTNAQSTSWAKRNSAKVRAAAASPDRKAMRAERGRYQREHNREHVLAQQRKHNASRRARLSERLRDRISRQIWGVLRGAKAKRNVLEIVGWTPNELRVHLERQFTKGMGWHNIGQWHIDHIVPLSSFTITGPDDPEIRRAWALSNLRPLWACDNIRKGAKRIVLL